MQVTFSTAKRILGVCENIQDRNFPFSVGYKFAKLKEFLEKELPIFLQEEQSILLEYSKQKNKDSVISNEKMEECFLKLKELEKTNLILTDLYFYIEELNNCDLSVNEIQALLPIIKKERVD